MAQELYALKRDLDMVNDDVQTLKHSYSLLDYIAKVVRDCQIEQYAQAAQMRRIEGEIKEMKKDIAFLKEDVASLKQDVASLKQDVTEIKKTLLLITKHLGIA